MGVSISTTGGKTHDKIATQRLTSNASSVTFSNIPQGYTDLYISLHVKNTGGAGYIVSWGGLQFNGNTTQSAYSATTMFSTSTNANASYQETQTGQLSMNVFRTDNNYYGTSFLHINNYSSNVMNKTVLGLSGGTTYFIMPSVGLWSVLDPVTSITFVPEGGTNFASGSVFTVYGIKAALSPKATGGDKVYTTGTHWVHEFYNSGLFVPRVALSSVDYLVIAGGGSGGGNGGSSRGAGGGGAGGYLTSIGGSSISLTASSGYTITVGAGGSRKYSEYPDGFGINGNNSSISGSGITTITATGGGGGGAWNGVNDYTAGKNGGSGGGAPGQTGVSGGAGTAGQGNAGGTGLDGSGFYPAGGGGGSGGVGGNASGTTAGSGGAGTASSITGSSVTRAGGGGGSTRGGTNGSGTAGGGNGGTQDGGDATANTGSGGGAAGTATGSSVATSGAGGSGIVIVRYPV